MPVVMVGLLPLVVIALITWAVVRATRSNTARDIALPWAGVLAGLATVVWMFFAPESLSDSWLELAVPVLLIALAGLVGVVRGRGIAQGMVDTTAAAAVVVIVLTIVAFVTGEGDGTGFHGIGFVLFWIMMYLPAVLIMLVIGAFARRGVKA